MHRLHTLDGPVEGKFFHALGRTVAICFVPMGLARHWDESEYLRTQWASFNCGVQAEPIGSHLLPDLSREETPDKATVARFQNAAQHFRPSA